MKTLLERTGYEVVDIKTHGSLDAYTLHWMSEMEIKGADWSGSMQDQFWKFVRGKLMNPKYFFPKQSSLGIMTGIGRLR